MKNVEEKPRHIHWSLALHEQSVRANLCVLLGKERSSESISLSRINRSNTNVGGFSSLISFDVEQF